MPPWITAKLSFILAIIFFVFGCVGAFVSKINSSVPVLFFLSVYAIVRAEMIAAQQYRELSERQINPPEQKMVEAIVESTNIESAT